MRNQDDDDDDDHHHHQQQLLLSLKCFIIFKALLLHGAQIAKGQAAPMSSCSAESSATCPKLNNVTFLFPFVSSQACEPGSASSFVMSGCSLSNSQIKPTWPDFVNATIPGTTNTTLSPPSVINFDNPFLRKSSNNTTNPVFGSINLTWNDTLVTKYACESLSPLDQISQYLPQSIDLSSFAHSAFRLTPSNIILLFNCTSSSAHLRNSSTACRLYETGCGLHNSNCSQFIPGSQELHLPHTMKKYNCANAMFFVAQQIYIHSVSQWIPGLIELNWSIHDPGIALNLKLCEGCLQTDGSCGYGNYDNFQCYCANNKIFDTNCTEGNRFPGCGVFLGCHIWPRIGFGAGGFAVALSLSLALFYIYKRKAHLKASVASSSPHVNRSWMKKPSFLSRKQDPISVKEMSYQEIVHATESFAEMHMLGDGGFGAVYKGVLADGCKVAVKRLYHDNYRRMEHFYNEIKVLSNLDHPNLVKLFGFCREDDKELLLVFEYAAQGTVSDHLHSVSKPPMSWKLRLDIACETADALSYLHNFVVPPIYHRDVKTTNILLDEGLHAKLADFGLSKFVPLRATHVSTAPQGTPGYLDPDYHQCYQLTDKSDVYSLGVVLMELISSKLAVDMSRERGEINLSTLAVMKIKCGRLEELVDPSLQMKKSPCVERSIRRVVELAFQCLQAQRDERPSMSSVAKTLTDIRREYAQNEGGDGEDLPTTHTSTPTTSQFCVSKGPNKLFEHPQDSPCSVFFSTVSSNPSIVNS